ncbi:GtrA family protein [Liquorilactobacillus sicerae]|uniref:GtrA family protein n=1 Tax=Liquorilactobacillus sicerae TaxID=1416943 RepID=UPI0024802703|nr:GtrA family protein [Liquorilactobacillus sicerae]
MKKAKIFKTTGFKFILVGIVNTLFGTAIMFLCYDFFKLSYWWSSAANYSLGSILSFVLNKYFTFQNHTHDWQQLVKFTINILICYVIAYGLAKPLIRSWLSTESQFIQDNVALLLGAVLFTAINYFGQRFWVFNLQK